MTPDVEIAVHTEEKEYFFYMHLHNLFEVQDR